MTQHTVCEWVEKNFNLGDRRRGQALGEMAFALVLAPVVSFAAIGRAMANPRAIAASCITRVFKFCHNPLLDVRAIQRHLVQLLVKSVTLACNGLGVAVVALDWHSYDNGAMSGLRLSLVTGSRTLPLTWCEVKTSQLRGQMGNLELEAIRDLMRFRPPGITWLILLDAGFRSPPLLRLLDEAGYFIVRTGSRTLVHMESTCWSPTGALPVAVGQIVDFGWVYLSQQNPLFVRLIGAKLYDIKPPKPGKRRSTTHHYKYSKPGLCFLATNLPTTAFVASLIVRLYGRRFEIEHNFRDIKNASLGEDMEHVHLLLPETYSRLMCIVAVSEAVRWLVGSEAESRGMHLQFTPSRPRDGRRVLSLRNVGSMAIEKIQGSIGNLIDRHLTPALVRVASIVGRTWRECKRTLMLGAAIQREADTVPLPDMCNRKGSGRPRPCLQYSPWPLPLVDTLPGPIRSAGNQLPGQDREGYQNSIHA
jgi:hypothetical protein